MSGESLLELAEHYCNPLTNSRTAWIKGQPWPTIELSLEAQQDLAGHLALDVEQEIINILLMQAERSHPMYGRSMTEYVDGGIIVDGVFHANPKPISSPRPPAVENTAAIDEYAKALDLVKDGDEYFFKDLVGLPGVSAADISNLMGSNPPGPAASTSYSRWAIEIGQNLNRPARAKAILGDKAAEDAALAEPVSKIVNTVYIPKNEKAPHGLHVSGFANSDGKVTL